MEPAATGQKMRQEKYPARRKTVVPITATRMFRAGTLWAGALRARRACRRQRRRSGPEIMSSVLGAVEDGAAGAEVCEPGEGR
jgi:hypothetical protein